MRWNWQQEDWPQFSYDAAQIQNLEQDFSEKNHFLSGAYHFLAQGQQHALQLDLLSQEALKTSEIEGEFLNRDSLRSSMAKKLGLQTENYKISPAEQSIVEMTLKVNQTFNQPLTTEQLLEWHLLLTQTRFDLIRVGSYRTHEEPMQVISGHSYKTKIHFEAPPSKQVKHEMSRFIKWFNETSPAGKNPLSALIRASITHLYFESIHPFEDGNGRIGRALVEKALAQCIGHTSLIALSTIIANDKKNYYLALEKANKSNEITRWLLYFSHTILSAQAYTQKLIRFLVEKTRIYEKAKYQINARQEKVITRMFGEGLSGFAGGLSAENYISIANTSRATATRDLSDLVEKLILRKTGQLKSTRYTLNISFNEDE